MVRKIIDIKSPILRKKSKPIAKLDKKILAIIKDMEDTLRTQKEPEGVGLAAPQIGKNLRIFVIEYEGIKRVVINPKIISISKANSQKSKVKSQRSILEGCLSLPNYYGPVKRANKIKIKYQTPKRMVDAQPARNDMQSVAGGWQMVTITEEFTGFHAHIIQHEIDHLEGILFIDKILEQDARLFLQDGKDWEEVDL